MFVCACFDLFFFIHCDPCTTISGMATHTHPCTISSLLIEAALYLIQAYMYADIASHTSSSGMPFLLLTSYVDICAVFLDTFVRACRYFMDACGACFGKRQAGVQGQGFASGGPAEAVLVVDNPLQQMGEIVKHFPTDNQSRTNSTDNIFSPQMTSFALVSYSSGICSPTDNVECSTGNIFSLQITNGVQYRQHIFPEDNQWRAAQTCVSYR